MWHSCSSAAATTRSRVGAPLRLSATRWPVSRRGTWERKGRKGKRLSWRGRRRSGLSQEGEHGKEREERGNDYRGGGDEEVACLKKGNMGKKGKKGETTIVEGETKKWPVSRRGTWERKGRKGKRLSWRGRRRSGLSQEGEHGKEREERGNDYRGGGDEEVACLKKGNMGKKGKKGETTIVEGETKKSKQASDASRNEGEGTGADDVDDYSTNGDSSDDDDDDDSIQDCEHGTDAIGAHGGATHAERPCNTQSQGLTNSNGPSYGTSSDIRDGGGMNSCIDSSEHHRMDVDDFILAAQLLDDVLVEVINRRASQSVSTMLTGS